METDICIESEIQPKFIMTKEEIIKYVREYDTFFVDAHLENYSYHELMLIKISIDVEKKLSKEVYIPMTPIGSLL